MSEFARFLVVGVANTIWGYFLIFFFMYGAGWSAEISNVGGYLIGLISSYLLNRSFAFRSKNERMPEFGRFIGVFAVAFAANFVALLLFVRVAGFAAWLGQILAGLIYVLTSYLLNRKLVFRQKANSPC